MPALHCRQTSEHVDLAQNACNVNAWRHTWAAGMRFERTGSLSSNSNGFIYSLFEDSGSKIYTWCGRVVFGTRVRKEGVVWTLWESDTLTSCTGGQRQNKTFRFHSLKRSSHHIIVETTTWRLQCSSFLVMTGFLIGDCNILPEKELRRNREVVTIRSDEEAFRAY